MRTDCPPNWSLVSALAFCLLAWSAGGVMAAKTTNIYINRSAAGFGHDLALHARYRLLDLKRTAIVGPASAAAVGISLFHHGSV